MPSQAKKLGIIQKTSQPPCTHPHLCHYASHSEREAGHEQERTGTADREGLSIVDLFKSSRRCDGRSMVRGATLIKLDATPEEVARAIFAATKPPDPSRRKLRGSAPLTAG